MNNFLNSKFYRKYLLPGFVFQSVVIAGGYGTGRELVEYFLSHGPLGGIYGMMVTTLVWGLVLAVTYDFVRIFKTYDYRNLFTQLLGRFWFLYEICYILLLFIVLAVVGAAAGTIVQDTFGIPFGLGVTLMLLAVAYLSYNGSKTIEAFMSWWSFVLYAVYIVFIAVGISKFGPKIAEILSQGEITSGWALDGFRYAFYNLGCISAILFTLSDIETRSEAVISGFISALITIIPGFLFYMVVLSGYPEIVGESIPAFIALKSLGLPALLIAYEVVLFGTLIETGTGFIHAVNERLAATLRQRDRELTKNMRGGIALGMVLLSIIMSRFGLIDLIATGYGTISWGFFVTHVVPILTIGVAKIVRAEKS
ncbi:MAG: hypothetical protein GX489_05085 [Firmicutes bacterium]|nr:hypothetical protein [Bacillota bacterium]